MRTSRLLMLCILVLALALAGCGGGGSTGSGGSSSGSTSSGSDAGGSDSQASDSPFDLDTAAEETLDITADGGGVAVHSSDATVAVYAPAGAADGAAWKVTPLASAPEGIDGVIVPGVSVDTGGAEPKQPCLIGFAVDGPVSPNTTVVRYTDDAMGFEAVRSLIATVGAQTIVSASVDGFSSYGLAEASPDAIPDPNEGTLVDWTIKVIGTEEQHVEGWTFKYELDMFASGAGVGMGGTYKGHSALFIEGEYDDQDIPYFSTMGELSGVGRDEALTFVMTDAPLVSLITGEPVGEPIVCGHGVMRMKGMGNLAIAAVGPNVSGSYDSGNVQGDDPVPFEIRVDGEDVQVEIANVGIFPGKILRTTPQ